jgi:hypothetical protein
MHLEGWMDSRFNKLERDLEEIDFKINKVLDLLEKLTKQTEEPVKEETEEDAWLTAVQSNRDKYEVLFSKHTKKKTNGCHIWTGYVRKWRVGTSVGSNPLISSQSRKGHENARVIRYALSNNVTVPHDYRVVSVCGDRLCVNPTHLVMNSLGEIVKQHAAEKKRMVDINKNGSTKQEEFSVASKKKS